MQDFEQLGVFYLGKHYDLDAKAPDESLLLYDSKDLTTHAVCVGMTGSGKTGLCLALLEEAAIDGIPALIIDPKGDLGNLLLTFPDLKPDDFQPWIDPADAARNGCSVDEYATKTAAKWKDGLAQWGEDGERIARFKNSADIAIYTPGSNAGLGLTVLRSFNAPGPELLADAEALRERVTAAASGLLALLGVDADPLRSREHILLSTLFDRAWRDGKDIDLGELIRSIQSPPFDKLGVMDLETIFPAKDRTALAMSLNNLLASPGFAAWMQGEPLDIQRLLYTAEGKPRLSILSIAHLTDAERMFFVTILLNEVIAWMRKQPGTSSLRALLYMDEVFGYFPPTANPPSKTPMLTLLKQARAYGVGCVLATQNPVDLDYKGLSNAGTWFLGRLQTERDKLRVLDGLEGASAAAGAKFNRGEIERILSGLGNRVFLMNNVHDDEPVVFQSRWALSYLRGPLTKDQIATLMGARKKVANPQSLAGSQPLVTTLGSTSDAARPMLPPDIPEVFLPRQGALLGDAKLRYRPGLLAAVRIHYVQKSAGVDHTEDLALMVPAVETLSAIIWDQAEKLDDGEPQSQAQPDSDAAFESPPPELTRSKTFAELTSALKTHIYRTVRLDIWKCPELKEYSQPGESEGDFRIRLTHGVKEERDLAVEKLKVKYDPKLATVNERLRKAEQRKEKQESQVRGQYWKAAAAALPMLIDFILQRRKTTNFTNVARTASNATKIANERQDVAQANESVEAVQDQKNKLNEGFTTEIAKIQEAYAIDILKLEQESVVPKKSDITIIKVVLAWTPWIIHADNTAEKAY